MDMDTGEGTEGIINKSGKENPMGYPRNVSLNKRETRTISYSAKSNGKQETLELPVEFLMTEQGRAMQRACKKNL